MATANGVYPRPPTGKRPDYQPKQRPGVRYVRRGSLPPIMPSNDTSRIGVFEGSARSSASEPGLDSTVEKASKSSGRPKTARSRAPGARKKNKRTELQQHPKKVRGKTNFHPYLALFLCFPFFHRVQELFIVTVMAVHSMRIPIR